MDKLDFIKNLANTLKKTPNYSDEDIIFQLEIKQINIKSAIKLVKVKNKVKKSL